MVCPLDTKVRRVRCPTCWNVLPELPDIPVYSCGGCGTVLQAKIQKSEIKDGGSCSRECSPSQTAKLDHEFEIKDDRNQNGLPTLSSSGALPLEENNDRDRDEFRDLIGNQARSGDMDCPNLLQSSMELTYSEIDQCSLESQAQVDLDESLEHCNRRDRDEFDEFNGEHFDGSNCSNAVHSTTELYSHDNKQSSPDSPARLEADENEYPLKEYKGEDDNEFGDCINDGAEEITISNDVSLLPELHLDDDKPPFMGAGAKLDVEGGSQNDFGATGRECYKNSNVSSSKLVCREIEEASPITVKDKEVGGKSAEILSPTRLRDPTITAERLSGDSILSYNEPVQQSQKNSLQEFERVSCVDTLENMPVVDPNSEPGIAFRGMYRSPTARSYYAYDTGISSYGGTDDRAPDRYRPLSKRNFKDGGFKDGGFISSRGLLRDEISVNGIGSSGSKMQHQVVNSSISQRQKHHTMNGSKMCQNEFSESRRNGYPKRHGTTLDPEGSVSKLPSSLMNFPIVQENGSPSRYGQPSGFHRRASFCPHNEPKHPEPQKLELMQRIHELEDQLTQLRILKGKENERLSSGIARNEKLVPAYYHPLQPAGERHLNAKFPRVLERSIQEKSWPHHCKISRTGLSGEASYGSHQADFSCLHCSPQIWHCSAQLPPHFICCNKRQQTTQPIHCTYHSSHASPQHFTRSAFSSQSHDIKSDDQLQKNHVVRKLYSREKRKSVKRHYRPMAGGAPIIACYHCSELLQLPADFICHGREWHHLRCSTCSKILKFSLEDRIHLVPYIPCAIAPPSSEIDEYSDAINEINVAATAPSHATGGIHAEPVSYSDDYGQSFLRSCSTDGDAVALPLRSVERNSKDKEMSSGNSSGPTEDRMKKGVLIESPSVNTFEAGTSFWPTEDRKKKGVLIEESHSVQTFESGTSFEPTEDRKKKGILIESHCGEIFEAGTSFQPIADRKKKGVLIESHYVGTSDSAGPSSSKMYQPERPSMEIEELLPATTDSPLHQLLGYSSPSQLLRR